VKFCTRFLFYVEKFFVKFCTRVLFYAEKIQVWLKVGRNYRSLYMETDFKFRIVDSSVLLTEMQMRSHCYPVMKHC
jgi:hypothetical protein